MSRIGRTIFVIRISQENSDHVTQKREDQTGATVVIPLGPPQKIFPQASSNDSLRCWLVHHTSPDTSSQVDGARVRQTASQLQ